VKAHLAQGAGIAHARIQDQATHAARLQRGRQQVAEKSVGAGRTGRHHQNIAWLALLDRHMEHPVVAGRHQHRHRRTADGDVALDRPYGVGQQAATPLGLVHGSHAEALQFIQPLSIGARDLPDHYPGLAEQAHPRFSVTRGKMLW
jgi:hypothetical protein